MLFIRAEVRVDLPFFSACIAAAVEQEEFHWGLKRFYRRVNISTSSEETARAALAGAAPSLRTRRCWSTALS